MDESIGSTPMRFQPFKRAAFHSDSDDSDPSPSASQSDSDDSDALELVLDEPSLPSSVLGTPDELEMYHSRSRTMAWKAGHRHARARSEVIHSLVLAQDSKTRLSRDKLEVDAVRALLQGLRVEKEEEERRERAAFDGRNQTLWQVSISSPIPFECPVGID